MLKNSTAFGRDLCHDDPREGAAAAQLGRNPQLCTKVLPRAKQETSDSQTFSPTTSRPSKQELKMLQSTRPAKPSIGSLLTNDSATAYNGWKAEL